MINKRETSAVSQFSVNGLKKGDKFELWFPIFNREAGLKIVVRLRNESTKELILNQDYSITFPANDTSTTQKPVAIVEYVGSDLEDVYALIVQRVITLSQETNFSSYGSQGRNEELSFDKITCALQDLNLEERSVHISKNEVNNIPMGTPKMELPFQRQNSILAFDESRNVRVIPEYTGGENTEVTDKNVINMHIDNATTSTDGLMSKEDKAKLDTVKEGAEENVQSDWNVSDTQNDAYINNKPQFAPVAFSNNYNDLDNKPALKPVATSGSYNDLDHRPAAGEGIELPMEEGYSLIKLRHASAEKLGGIKIGRNLTIDYDGTLHAESGIQDLVAGTNILIDNVGGIHDGGKGAFHSVIYAHGLYVAIGYGVIGRSPNGRNWIINNVVDWFPTLPLAATLNSIVFDDTRFIISVRTPACFLEISKDFTSHNLIRFYDDTRIDGIVRFKDNGIYGVYGDYQSTGVGFVRCTSDFREWEGPVATFANYFRGDHACYISHYTPTTSMQYVFFTGGTNAVVRGIVNGNFVSDLVAYPVTDNSFLTGIINAPAGLLVTSSDGKIYRTLDFGETWELWSQIPDNPTNMMIDSFGYNDTQYYAAAGGSLFFSEDGGKHWRDAYLGEQYVFSGLHITNEIIVAAGAQAMHGDGRHLYYIPLGDLSISAIDTTYDIANPWLDGLMGKDDKRKLDDLSTVAITGSYNDLSNKLVGGENIHIDENNVVSYVGGVGEDLYKAGDHIRIDKAHNVKQCYTDANSTVDILLHNDEHVTAPLYPNKLMLSEVSRKCEEWKEVVFPFEYSGYGVVRSNDKMYVVDKDNHVRVSRIDDLVTWIDDGQIPKAPAEYRHYKGAYGVCSSKEHVVFYAVVNSDPAETAIAYYIDGIQRTLKVLPYRIVGITFDENRIYCTTDAVDILVYNAEFTYLLQILSIPETSLIDAQYLNNRLLVLAWSNNSNKCLYASASPYSSFEKVTDDFDKDALNKIFVYKNTFSFVYDNKLYTSDDAFNWSYATLDKAYEFGIYLNKFSLVYEKSNYVLYKHMGGMNTISATYENATTSADGLMSKEDKIKLNAAIKFPDGEVGYTLPNAAGRADKIITFDSEGNLDLHGTHDYDKWRNVRIPTDESTIEVNLELPRASGRANKVIGFSDDGKKINMKEFGGGVDITVGKGLQKIGNEISLQATFGGALGGIYQMHRPDNDLLIIEPDGQAYAQLPTARADRLGGIKVGAGLNIDTEGVLSATAVPVLTALPFVAGAGIKITSCDWSYSLLNPEADFADTIYWYEKKIHIAAEGVNLWHSYDLKVWSKCIILGSNTKKINCLIVDGDKVYAGGDLGLLMTSADGVSWEITKTGTAYGMTGIVIADGRFFFLHENMIFEKTSNSLVQSFINSNGGTFTGIKKLLNGDVFAFGENGTIVRYENGIWKLEYEEKDTIIKDMMYQNNYSWTFALQNKLSSGTGILWISHDGTWKTYTSNSVAMSMNSFCDKNTGYNIFLYIAGAEGKMYYCDILNSLGEWKELPQLSSNINKIYASHFTPMTIAGHQAIYKEEKNIMITVRE